MADLTYPKSVRLHHRKAFQTLLDKGSTHYNAVFKVYWLRREAESAEGCDAGGCRFAVSVPKRSFKRAVKRNLLKRRTREAIRLNRSLLPEGLAADFLFFYRAPEVCDYAAVEKAVMETFEAVAAKVAAPADPDTETPLFVDGSDNQDGSHE
ncbi:MAG: ribonuclease P protein component [Bacteroidales bacterium]|nr:ribonuclease P protein component [Bacteroidales bacterium]